jgi:hypothetical protein
MPPQKLRGMENRFKSSGLDDYQKPKTETRKIVIKFASKTRKNSLKYSSK